MVSNPLVLVARYDAKVALERSKSADGSKCSFIIPLCVATAYINSAFFEYLSIILHGRIVEEVFVRSASQTNNIVSSVPFHQVVFIVDKL